MFAHIVFFSLCSQYWCSIGHFVNVTDEFKSMETRNFCFKDKTMNQNLLLSPLLLLLSMINEVAFLVVTKNYKESRYSGRK